MNERQPQAPPALPTDSSVDRKHTAHFGGLQVPMWALATSTVVLVGMMFVSLLTGRVFDAHGKPWGWRVPTSGSPQVMALAERVVWNPTKLVVQQDRFDFGEQSCGANEIAISCVWECVDKCDELRVLQTLLLPANAPKTCRIQAGTQHGDRTETKLKVGVVCLSLAK